MKETHTEQLADKISIIESHALKIMDGLPRVKLSIDWTFALRECVYMFVAELYLDTYKNEFIISKAKSKKSFQEALDRLIKKLRI